MIDMKYLINKISSYDLFVNLLPGVIFAVISEKVTTYSFLQKDIVIGFFVYYLIGLMLNSFGSVVLKPLLIGFEISEEYTEYCEFISACKMDTKIELLSEKNNMYLTLSSLFALLIILKFWEWSVSFHPVLKEYGTSLLLLFLMIVFVLSYKKQTNYIKKRIKESKK
jgi:hypothetical protein